MNTASSSAMLGTARSTAPMATDTGFASVERFSQRPVPAVSDAFAVPTVVFGDGQQRDFVVGEREILGFKVFQRCDRAADLVQVNRYVPGLVTVGVLAGLVELLPRR
jgi:hypothetical protein